MQAISSIEKLHESYKGRAHFFVIYIREAHPTDGWVVPNNKFLLKDPKSIEERQKAARDFANQMKLTLPILVDTLEDPVDKVYAGWPDRVYILDKAGKIVHKGATGPGGFGPSIREAPALLERLLKKDKE